MQKDISEVDIRSLINDGEDQLAIMRPWRDESGTVYVTLSSGDYKVDDLKERGSRCRVWDCQRHLTKADWSHLDRAAAKGYADKTPLVSTLRDLGAYTTVAGIQKLSHTYGPMADNEAVSPIKEVAGEVPLLKMRSVPLPLTHSDWLLSHNVIVDSVLAEEAGRRVGECIDGSMSGSVASFVGGDGSDPVYGLAKHPERFRLERGSTNLSERDLNAEINDAMALLESNKFYGPYVVFYGKGHLGRFGETSKATRSWDMLRKQPSVTQLKPGVERFSPMDLYNDDIIVVQADKGTVEVIECMKPTLLRWDERTMKFAAITTLVVRTDYLGKVGIAHIE